MPFVSAFALMALLMTAVMAERAANGTVLDEKSFIGAQSEITAMMGLKFAEDWLVGEFRAGRVPVGRIVMNSGADVRSSYTELADFLDRSDVELQIAATADYLAYAASNAGFTPNIPSDVTNDGVLRYYSLKSEAAVAGQNILITEEELLSVLISHTGTLTEAARLFYKSRSERKR
ncbi:MAG: hypothetical protein LBI74_03625 [Synergistaceae bacterium]|nr:hypothetical protein [Synergistaceae bacterium]